MDMPDPAALAGALTDAAKAINSTQTVQETLDSIVAAALRSVPGFDSVGISITHHGGKVETMAATDRFVWDLDTLQYELGEGPCLDAIRQETVVVVENARHEQRWPRYIPAALQRGLQAQMGICLFDDGSSVGGLNFYATSTEGVPAGAREVAEMFAEHAAIALGRTRREENLTEALRTRQVIGQATGIVMERYHVDADRAFAFLVRASQTGNVKLRDIAQELIDTANSSSAR
ncbi:MAG: GAF and ANTAR domain-containing protein [Marmoricola sp.]